MKIADSTVEDPDHRSGAMMPRKVQAQPARAKPSASARSKPMAWRKKPEKALMALMTMKMIKPTTPPV